MEHEQRDVREHERDRGDEAGLQPQADLSRRASPPIAAERQVRDRAGERGDHHVPRRGCGSSWVDRRPASRRRPAAAGTPARRPTAPGSAPAACRCRTARTTPSGSSVSRPHNRGVGSPSRAATKARAYSRALMPISRDHAEVERRTARLSAREDAEHPLAYSSRGTSGGGATAPSARVNAASTAAAASRASSAVRAWTSPIGSPASSRSPILRRHHDTRRRGRSGRPCGSGPRPSATLARPIASASTAAERTGPVGLDRHDDRRPGQDGLGIVDDARVAALRLDHPSGSARAPSRRRARARRAPTASPCGDALGRLERPSPRRRTARSRSRPRNVPAEQLDRLGDVERVADRVAERLRHVRHGDVGARGPIRAPATRHARASTSASSGVFMNAPDPAFTSRRIRSVVHRELLRHHARRDQRDRRHRRGGVAQGVELAVGRHEVRGLGGDRAPDPLDLSRDLLGRRGRSAGPGSTRACRACRRCGRGRGPTASRPPGRARRPSGANTSVTPSATPPVECLSTRGRPTVAERSTVSPESIIARVSASVSSASRPAEQARHEERGGERVARRRPRCSPRRRPRTSAGASVPPSRLRGHDRRGDRSSVTASLPA